MPIHIGKKIKEVLDQRGMSISEFGRRIHKSRENIYSIFKRRTIDSGLLYLIGETLEHDFFKYYSDGQHDGKGSADSKELERLKKENMLLMEINTLLKSKGYPPSH
jgi:hypothetical protein